MADESDAEQGPRKPKRQRLVLPESSSTEDEQGDTGNSGIPSPAKSHPLTVSPLASRPPATSSNTSRLGVFSLGDELIPMKKMSQGLLYGLFLYLLPCLYVFIF